MSGGLVIQVGIDGLAAAALYALIGLAVAVAASGSGVLHFAIGEVAMAGGLVAAAALSSGLPLPVAILAGVGAGAAVSVVLERSLVRPATGRATVGAVALVAGAALLHQLLLLLFPRSAYAFPAPDTVWRVGDGVVRAADLIDIAIAAAVASATVVVLRRSRAGIALRIAAAAPEAAETIGIDTGRLRSAAFAAAGAVAAVAAMAGSARVPIAAGAGVALAVKGLAVAVIGGVTRPGGVLLAALGLGLIEVVAAQIWGGGGEAVTLGVALLAVVVARR